MEGKHWVSLRAISSFVCVYANITWNINSQQLRIKMQEKNYGIYLTFPAFWMLTFSKIVQLPVLSIFPGRIFYVNACNSEHESKQHLEANKL